MATRPLWSTEVRGTLFPACAPDLVRLGHPASLPSTHRRTCLLYLARRVRGPIVLPENDFEVCTAPGHRRSPAFLGRRDPSHPVLCPVHDRTRHRGSWPVQTAHPTTMIRQRAGRLSTRVSHVPHRYRVAHFLGNLESGAGTDLCLGEMVFVREKCPGLFLCYPSIRALALARAPAPVPDSSHPEMDGLVGPYRAPVPVLCFPPAKVGRVHVPCRENHLQTHRRVVRLEHR